MPAGDVQITFTPLTPTISVAPTTLVFTAADWNITQDIQITAVDDAEAIESPHTAKLGITSSSVDPNFENATIPNFEVTIEDNDLGKLVLCGPVLTVEQSLR